MAEKKKQGEPKSAPPGHFVSDAQRIETGRFIDELKKRLGRKKSESEPKLGPPR